MGVFFIQMPNVDLFKISSWNLYLSVFSLDKSRILFIMSVCI